jgi:hypothetical protein
MTFLQEQRERIEYSHQRFAREMIGKFSSHFPKRFLSLSLSGIKSKRAVRRAEMYASPERT